jgi:hypothetical protein
MGLNMQSRSSIAVAAQPADDEERPGDPGGEPAIDHHHWRQDGHGHSGRAGGRYCKYPSIW